MPHDVFISHSSADKRAADAACAVLEGRGIKCWTAPRDIRPGADWGEAIINAIEQSRIMLLLLSSKANSSPQIKREVERAVHRSIIIIPVRLENVKPARSLEYFLSTSHWMDAFPPPFENHLENLARTIHQFVFGSPIPFSVSHRPVPRPPWWQRHGITLMLGAGLLALIFATMMGFLIALAISWNRKETKIVQHSPTPQSSVVPPVQTFTPTLQTPAPVLSPSISPPPSSGNDLSLLAGTWNESFDDARATPLTQRFAGTPAGNIVMAALTNSAPIRKLTITAAGVVEIHGEPEDAGSYSFDRGYLTLVSGRTRGSDSYQYRLSAATTPIPLVAAAPGDGLLDLTGFSSYQTRWVRKGDGNPQSLIGSWRTPLLTFVTGKHLVYAYAPATLEFRVDHTYILHLIRTQTGALTVANGSYTLTSGIFSASGNYRFGGSNEFVDTQSGMTSIWRRVQ